ncbi:Wwp1 [Symbiodinium pilosum]|uniref:Wwp1 protein n=1 Tax=Symbiodinium pilosum TaxID=2952 RepID=A0A812IPK8_SYMPI|nr:Wwp1 [Symbiodinium pilosum]
MADVLPEGWSAYQDDQGRTYYANITPSADRGDQLGASGASSAPAGGLDGPPGNAHCVDCFATLLWALRPPRYVQDEQGRTFYANCTTGESSPQPRHLEKEFREQLSSMARVRWSTSQVLKLDPSWTEELMLRLAMPPSFAMCLRLWLQEYFAGRCDVVDKARYDSVTAAVDEARLHAVRLWAPCGRFKRGEAVSICSSEVAS